MAALPYIPLFVADYLADTRHLTAQQHGAYLLLIFNYWQTGKPLPNDDAKLARIACMNKRDWARNRDAILEFFSIRENLLVHSRIDTELSRVEAKSLKSKKAAQASVERRLNGRSADAERTLSHTQAHTHTYSVSKDTGASADSDKVFWANAKAFIKPEVKGDPGTVIGKWSRDYGREATAQAITRAQLERPVQRVPFIVGCLKLSKQDEHSWDFMP